MECFPPRKELFLEFHDYSEQRKETVICNCLQNCLNSNVILEKYQVLKGTKQLLGSIGGLLIMKKYPLVRFKREVLFTLTDLFGECKMKIEAIFDDFVEFKYQSVAQQGFSSVHLYLD